MSRRPAQSRRQRGQQRAPWRVQGCGNIFMIRRRGLGRLTQMSTAAGPRRTEGLVHRRDRRQVNIGGTVAAGWRQRPAQRRRDQHRWRSADQARVSGSTALPRRQPRGFVEVEQHESPRPGRANLPARRRRCGQLRSSTMCAQEPGPRRSPQSGGPSMRHILLAATALVSSVARPSPDSQSEPGSSAPIGTASRSQSQSVSRPKVDMIGIPISDGAGPATRVRRRLRHRVGLPSAHQPPRPTSPFQGYHGVPARATAPAPEAVAGYAARRSVLRTDGGAPPAATPAPATATTTPYATRPRSSLQSVVGGIRFTVRAWVGCRCRLRRRIRRPWADKACDAGAGRA